jgi:hypothetical protein
MKHGVRDGQPLPLFLTLAFLFPADVLIPPSCSGPPAADAAEAVKLIAWCTLCFNNDRQKSGASVPPPFDLPA